ALSQKEGRCVVIPNGIEVQRFREALRRDMRRELIIGSDVFLIGFFGRFMSQKGFRYLVDAIEILCKDAEVKKKPLVLTFGEGAFIREEKLAIKDRRLEEYFRFMPFT